jgi:hypothetical protein
MTHPSEDIKTIFQKYTDAFNTKKASNLIPFFHYPTILIDRDKKPAFLGSIIGSIKARIGLGGVIKELQKQGFDHSKLDDEPQVKLLSETLGIITGNATRYKTDHSPLESFGYTYTFRKTSEGWKIITGIIHD